MTQAVPGEASEPLILVDEDNRVLSTGEKFAAHRTGALHRAFSVFVFRPDGKLLLQKRARVKYHSGGKWANTACGHPRPGEPVAEAGMRRLLEETGIRCDLGEAFMARYRADLDNGMIENEIVHVLFGLSSQPGTLNPLEVSDYRDVALDDLREDLATRPEDYAIWLVRYFERHVAQIYTARDRLLLAAGLTGGAV